MRLFILAIVLLFPLNAVAAKNQIGYVDLRRALNSVEDGRFAKNKLKKKKADYQKKLNSAQIALKKAKKQFDARRTILRGAAKKRAQQDLQKKFFKLQKMYSSLTRVLAKEEAIETRKIFKKMEAIIQGIAKENNLILMLERTESSVLYARPGMNFTSELIRRYDKIYGSGKKSGKKAPRKRKNRRRR